MSPMGSVGHDSQVKHCMFSCFLYYIVVVWYIFVGDDVLFFVLILVCYHSLSLSVLVTHSVKKSLTV